MATELCPSVAMTTWNVLNYKNVTSYSLIFDIWTLRVCGFIHAIASGNHHNIMNVYILTV